MDSTKLKTRMSGKPQDMEAPAKAPLPFEMGLAGASTPINGVVTRITLEKATSKGGKPCRPVQV